MVGLVSPFLEVFCNYMLFFSKRSGLLSGDRFIVAGKGVFYNLFIRCFR